MKKVVKKIPLLFAIILVFAFSLAFQELDNEKFEKLTFWGTRIINLPTSRSLGKGRWLFRISHRFFPSASLGYDVFYGLDGPASILLSLGYGITENFSLTLARANVFKEFESTLRWKILKESKSLG